MTLQEWYYWRTVYWLHLQHCTSASVTLWELT